MEADARRVSHWGLRKLSVGVASVLLGTTLYFGMAGVVHADTLTSRASSNQTNVVAKNSTNSGTEASGDHQQVAVDSADKMANDQNQAETAMPAQPDHANRLIDKSLLYQLLASVLYYQKLVQPMLVLKN